jgi:hypothetical protein
MKLIIIIFECVISLKIYRVFVIWLINVKNNIEH